MFAEPEKILKFFGLQENMVVADLGAGSGFYTIPIAHLLTGGKVYAVEIQKDFLDTIRNKIKELKLENVECLWGDVEVKGGTRLKDDTIDRVVASNILFQIEHKEKFLDEIKRILKPQGKVLLIDWHDSDSPLAPKGNRLVKEERARSLFESRGFIFERIVDAGEHHYGMIFKVNK